jgi:hypothetical protein
MEEYRSTLSQNDLMSGATVVCTSGQMNLLGEYKVVPGEMVAMGFGDDITQGNAIGRLYMLLNVAGPTESAGVVRLVVMSATDRQYQIIYESRTEIIDANATDRTKQLPLPLFNLFVTENKRIALFFQPDTTATLTKSACVIRVDVTRVAL